MSIQRSILVLLLGMMDSGVHTATVEPTATKFPTILCDTQYITIFTSI